MGAPDGRRPSPSAAVGAGTSRSGQPHRPRRAARRRAAATRRNRALLAAAAVISGVVLVAWFPGAELLHQRHELGAAAAQLDRLRHENSALQRQAKNLRTPAAVGRIAEQQYDLVPPGEQAYQVLPKSGSGGSASLATGAPSSGSSGRGRAPSEARAAVAAAPGSFFGRMLQTLEFWR